MKLINLAEDVMSLKTSCNDSIMKDYMKFDYSSSIQLKTPWRKECCHL